RPGALARVDPHPAAHRGDEALRDEEPKPRTGRRRITCHGIPTVKLREDPALLLFGDPDPLVDDLDLDHLVVRARSHGHPASVWRELDRIVYEVRQDLP